MKQTFQRMPGNQLTTDLPPEQQQTMQGTTFVRREPVESVAQPLNRKQRRAFMARAKKQHREQIKGRKELFRSL